MESLTELVTQLLGPSPNNDLIGMAFVAGILLMLALVILALLPSGENAKARRLRGIKGESFDKSSDPGGDRVAATMRGLSPIVMPKNDEETSKIKAKLIHAGYRKPNAILNFFAIKAGCALALPALVLLAMPFFPDIAFKKFMFFAMGAAAIGIFGPNMVLEKLAEKRQNEIRHAFPDALDLLVVCVEAGLGFDLAIKRIADEMRTSHPVLAEEFGLVSAEIRAGIDRIKALRNFAIRTGLDEVTGFVALLSQSLKFGTSIGDTLRIYSEDFRDKRTQKAEELAAKVGTKLIFPLVFCFFPSFFVIAVGPVVLKVMAVLK